MLFVALCKKKLLLALLVMIAINCFKNNNYFSSSGKLHRTIFTSLCFLVHDAIFCKGKVPINFFM